MWSRPCPTSRENGYERLSNVAGESSCSYQSISSDDDDSENEIGRGSKSRNNNNSTRPRPRGKLRNSTSSSEAVDFKGRNRRPSPKSALQVYRPTSNSDRISSKRKRDDAEEDEFPMSGYNAAGRSQKCHSRNAIMARQNRIKKKLHLESLETSVSKLTQENENLQVTLDDQKVTVTSLKERVRYLEGVLANSRELGMLLNSVKNSTGLPAIHSLRRNAGKTRALGFPPPQPDHIYSKTPDVLLNCSISPSGEDNVKFTPYSFLAEDSVGPLIADDVSLSPLPVAEEDLPFPKSDDSFDIDFNEFNHPFDFEGLEDSELLGDVGICLHIAKKRVSLEFCSSCNNNSTAVWNNNISAT